MTKKVAVYARVSTDRQSTASQILELRAIAAQREWSVVEEFTDNGISGSKGRDKRPAFDKMCDGITRGKFDLVASWSVDRLGRSLHHLVEFMELLRASNVDLYVLKQAIDTTGPGGRLMFHVTSAFAEFEREMIRARVKAGLKRTTKTLGRPPTVSTETRDAVAKASMEGASQREIARKLGVPRTTVQRILSK